MGMPPRIGVAEFLAELSSHRDLMRQFATGDQDAAIDGVIDAIAGETLTPDERNARFDTDKRDLVKNGTLAQIQAAVSQEWKGAIVESHVC
jgi:hypothetical protein